MINMRYPLITFSVCSFHLDFPSFFAKLKFSSPKIIKDLILMEYSGSKKFRGKKFTNAIFLNSFLT